MKIAWDNANIVESYPGVCSPLTYSFARHVYRGVYLQTVRLFGVPEERAQRERRQFESFLGYLHGRFYYNLNTWNYLVAFLPGFKKNGLVLQQMMGVRESDQLALPSVKTSRWQKVNTLVRFSYYYLCQEQLTRKWLAKFDRHFIRFCRKIDTITTAGEAMELFFETESLFLDHWQVPILNDFLVMIHGSRWKRLAAAYGDSTLSPAAIGTVGKVGNALAVAELQHIATIIQRHQLEPLLVGRPELIIDNIRNNRYVGRQVEQFINNYGLRNGNDLKLENPNLNESPAVVIKIIKAYLSNDQQASNLDVLETESFDKLPKAIIRASRRLREVAYRRENLRFRRSQLYGAVRKIFLCIGRDFAAQQVLAKTDDVFYLEMEEIFNYIRGMSTVSNLRQLVTIRKTEGARWQTLPTVPGHINTTGLPHLAKLVKTTPKPRTRRTFSGKPNFPGTVRATVVVLAEPNWDEDVKGKILVCRQTDPSWVPFFGLISGLIVEKGGILSHAAIVSREFRVPSIIGADHVFDGLKTGQIVEMDARQGIIKICDE